MPFIISKTKKTVGELTKECERNTKSVELQLNFQTKKCQNNNEKYFLKLGQLNTYLKHYNNIADPKLKRPKSYKLLFVIAWKYKPMTHLISKGNALDFS